MLGDHRSRVACGPNMFCPICLENEVDATNLVVLHCGHGIHVECLRFGIPDQCHVCRVLMEAEDYIQIRAAALSMGIDLHARSSRDAPRSPLHPADFACRTLAVSCCPRLGPPPDFMLLADRRMQFIYTSQTFFCDTCHLEVPCDYDLIRRYQRRCFTHGDVMCVFVQIVDKDVNNLRFSFACPRGPSDDVPEPMEDCAEAPPTHIDMTVDEVIDLINEDRNPPDSPEPELEASPYVGYDPGISRAMAMEMEAELDELQILINSTRFAAEFEELQCIIDSTNSQ